ncbi:MAG: hypothetical protein U0350_48765 [Caldilineaceae bacterium]
MDRQPKQHQPTLFPLGHVVATPGALAALRAAGQNPFGFLRRHLCGDWGDLEEIDRLANEQALQEDSRLMSAYQVTAEFRLWIITEADRSVTTLLLPQDY